MSARADTHAMTAEVLPMPVGSGKAQRPFSWPCAVGRDQALVVDEKVAWPAAVVAEVVELRDVPDALVRHQHELPVIVLGGGQKTFRVIGVAQTDLLLWHAHGHQVALHVREGFDLRAGHGDGDARWRAGDADRSGRLLL